MVPSPQLTELADGVFVWEHAVTDRFTCNVGVVVSDDDLTLIDTDGRPAAYGPLRERLSSFARPVTRVVLTHDHLDHVAGAVVFPDAEILATPPTAGALARRPPIEILQALHPPIAGELAGLTHPTPTRLIERPTALGRLDLAPLGGHTRGDLVVVVADADVCFTGDLCFFGHVPLGIGADFVQWEVSLDWLPTVARFVPGHGPVGTAHDVEEVRAYLAAVNAAADRGADTVEPGPWDRWWHPWQDHRPDAVHRMNVEQARNPDRLPPTLAELAQPPVTPRT